MPYTFFTQSLKRMRQVGSLVPSSRFLASSMCEHIDSSAAINIVELGPGTGPVTRSILPRMNGSSRLLCIEQNQAFVDHLKRSVTDERVHIVQGDAQNMDEYLAAHGMTHVDCIVSSLPLSNIPKQIKADILEACKKHLKPDGHFLQYQYSLNDKKMVKNYFSDMKTDFVLINFPPAFVYKCIN